MRWILITLLFFPVPQPGTIQALPKVLFLTHSAGFKHSVVTRPNAETLSLAEKQLIEAAKGRFEVVATQDCGTITKEKLSEFKAVVFYTTGELPIDKEALIDFVKAGGGFAGMHCATDTLYKYAPYGEMIGGYFDGHPWHQKVKMKVEDLHHPATNHLGLGFEITDEIYQFKNWDRNNVHVLLSLDPASVDVTKQGVHRTDKDFAVAWTRTFEKGRVFYTGLGHREELWKDPRYLEHVVNGIAWTFHQREAIEDEGFEVLFDGIHADGWKQAGPGGFKLKDGEATSFGGMGLWYYERRQFRNFILKTEFKMQKVESNSGVFVRFPRVEGDPWIPVREGHEIQIQGDKPSKQTTGSIYDFQAPTEIPLKSPGEWNEFEITCIGRDYWVRLNHRLITTYTSPRSLVGMVGLQNHSDADVVSFRSVRVKDLPDEATSYHVLFDGHDTKGWKMCGPGNFEFKEGLLTSHGGMGLYWYEQEFQDFTILVDWRVTRREDNSGVFVRFPDPGNDPWIAVNKGHEIQICDAQPPEARTGCIISSKASTHVPVKKIGEWNHYEITVVGQNYSVRINGELVTEYASNRSLKGFVGLQNHTDEDRVTFRDVRVIGLHEPKRKEY